MNSVFKSVKLDNYIMKPYYRALILLFAVATAVGVLTKIPAITVTVVLIISAPFNGTYFSAYEKNNLDKLYGVLPLRKLDVVTGRYLYALLFGIINGIIAGIITYVISLVVGTGFNFLGYLNYLSMSFLGYSLLIGILFPIYFKYPFSKVYILTNLPMYLCGVIVMYLIRKKGLLMYLGVFIKYFSNHQYLIWATGFGLGLYLLFISFLFSYAFSGEVPGPNLPTERTEKRLFFADNLRTWMVILVVLQHLAELNNTLYLFMMLNQAYFMGLLFLLSGYFTPGSFERKGPRKFLLDRLLRLGVPTLIYVFLLSPITKFGKQPVLAGNTTVSLFSLGVMWFAVMLLVFDLGYLAWRMAVKNRPGRPVAANHPQLSFRIVALSMLVLAAASYLIRFDIPYGMSLFGFPSLDYLSQYVGFFLIGLLAYRRDWLRAVPGSHGALGLALALLATIILFPVALIGSGSAFIGHGSWQSAVFALWDSIFAIGMSLALITFFRRFFNGEKKFGRFLSQYSFTVYIIHPIVIVFLTRALSGIYIQTQLKFGLDAVIGIPLCFMVAYLVRKIPFTDRVL